MVAVRDVHVAVPFTREIVHIVFRVCSKFKTERIISYKQFCLAELSVGFLNILERVKKCIIISASGFCGSVCGNLRVEFSVFLNRPVVNVYLYIHLKSLLKLLRMRLSLFLMCLPVYWFQLFKPTWLSVTRIM